MKSSVHIYDIFSATFPDEFRLAKGREPQELGLFLFTSTSGTQLLLAVRPEDQQIRSLGLIRTPDLKSRYNHRVDPLIRQLRSASPHHQPYADLHRQPQAAITVSRKVLLLSLGLVVGGC